MSDSFNDTEQLWSFMEEHMVTDSFRGEPQEYLPDGAFQRATTKECIRLAIEKDGNPFLGNQEQVEPKVELVYRKARRIFAISFYAYNEHKYSPMTIVDAILKEGLTDESLPLKKGSFKDDKFQKALKSFFDNQQRLCVAHFRLNSFQRLDGLTKPIKLDESESNRLGKGAFGEVFTVQINPEQRSFSSGANTNDEFALKVTRHEGRELDFHRHMADINHPHVLKCLASFTHSSKYHMIYEKADYDVENFMYEHQTAENRVDLSPSDLASQFAGMAAGLRVIHNQEKSSAGLNSNGLIVPGNQPTQSGYIHDIKPDNILLFIYVCNDVKRYWFRLSDFSCAKVANLLSIFNGKRRSHLSDNKAGNPTYQAPEQMLGHGTSRPYDLWSLGLVYLEILVWYLDGYEALDRFRKDREQSSQGEVQDDGFCYITGTGATTKAHLRDVVQDKLTDLSTRCKAELKVIADVLPDLLKINPKDRPTAAQLAERLSPLDTGERPPEVDHPQQRLSTIFSRAQSPTPSFDSESDFSSSDGFFKVTRPSK